MGPRNGTKVGQILNFCQIEGGGRMWLLPVFFGGGQILAEKSRTGAGLDPFTMEY
jgi:hypothetical protein